MARHIDSTRFAFIEGRPRSAGITLSPSAVTIDAVDNLWPSRLFTYPVLPVAPARQVRTALGLLPDWGSRLAYPREPILTASPELRIVAKTTVGVDDIDLDAATELGILVTHAPVESNWGNVAENTIAYLLAFAKRVRERDAEIKSGGWRRENIQGHYVGSRESDGYEGITLGIIGLGRIGGRVAQLMRPWNIRILAYDPYVPDYRFLEFHVKPVDLETLLRESDFVTVHVVLNRETRHMISTAEMAMMKPGAILINTARGGAVDEAALADALERGVIAGAALDCFEQEPVAPDSPLRRMGDKVILTPHGGLRMPRTAEGGYGGGPVWAAESVLDALRGKVPDHVFNTEAIALWQQRFAGQNALQEASPIAI